MLGDRGYGSKRMEISRDTSSATRGVANPSRIVRKHETCEGRLPRDMQFSRVAGLSSANNLVRAVVSSLTRSFK